MLSRERGSFDLPFLVARMAAARSDDGTNGRIAGHQHVANRHVFFLSRKDVIEHREPGQQASELRQRKSIDGKRLAINLDLLWARQQISEPADPVTCWKSTVPCEIV